MAKRTPDRKNLLHTLARQAKRIAQKSAGAFDGRFRPRVVKSRKTYSRKRKHKGGDSSDG